MNKQIKLVIASLFIAVWFLSTGLFTAKIISVGLLIFSVDTNVALVTSLIAMLVLIELLPVIPFKYNIAVHKINLFVEWINKSFKIKEIIVMIIILLVDFWFLHNRWYLLPSVIFFGLEGWLYKLKVWLEN